MAEPIKSDQIDTEEKRAESFNQDLPKEGKVDTVHNDQALEVIVNYDGDREWTEQEEKLLVRKIDKRLLLILFLTYGLQYYDKAMLSQAVCPLKLHVFDPLANFNKALFGLREDLDLHISNRYSMSSSIFYLGFIAGAYPAILLAQRYSIERVIFGIVLIWGVCLILTVACSNYQGLYAQRFFLGFLESGVSPAWMMVVGLWYKKQEQALRMGIWFCSTGYASMVSPLLNYGLGHITGALAPWRYMYIFAGSITILWAFVIYFFMPPDPVRAKGFTERERFIAVSRMRINNSGVRNTHFKIAQLWEILLDIKFWLVFAMAFCIVVANGPFSTFAPIIISQLGFSGLNSLLLLLPAGFVTGTVSLVAPYCAYRFPGWRAHIVTICVSGTILASLLLWQLPMEQVGGRLFAIYILASYGGGYAVLMSLAIANTAGYTKKSLASSGLFVGYCGGNILAPMVFKADEAPGYSTGWITVVVTSIATALLAQVYRALCVWQNKTRDKVGAESFDNAYDDDLTDLKNPQFRYTL